MNLDIATVETARRRLIEMHYQARTGHLGGNLSSLDSMLLIYHELMGADDRFVLSKGHSAGALYVTLWSMGRLTDADLTTFHQENTLLAGHPPPNAMAEILFATGSLGHGLSLAAGLALASRIKGENRRVFCLTSDGEWQEGSTLEALIFAAHHKLSNLTILVDHNRLQGFGSTDDVASMDPLDERLSGFEVDLRQCDGHDLNSLRDAVGPLGNRPSVVIMHTRKGNGVPEFEGLMQSHYLPLSEQQYSAAIDASKARR